jgi:hypothetical protein
MISCFEAMLALLKASFTGMVLIQTQQTLLLVEFLVSISVSGIWRKSMVSRVRVDPFVWD